jgi:hypothetical protein
MSLSRQRYARGRRYLADRRVPEASPRCAARSSQFDRAPAQGDALREQLVWVASSITDEAVTTPRLARRGILAGRFGRTSRLGGLIQSPS